MGAVIEEVLIIIFCASVVVVGVAQSDHREEVNASDIMGRIKNGEPVYYFNKIIEGDINIGILELPEVPGFSGKSKNLKLVRSPFILSNCLIKGNLDLSNALLTANTSFKDNIISGEVNIRESLFSQSADFSYSQFNNLTDFSYSQFRRSALFYGAQFNQSADFQGARFQFNDFSNSRFRQSANFNWSQFNQSTDFSWSQFDQAYFYGAHFSEITYFMNTTQNLSFFGQSHFNSYAYFIGSILKSVDFRLAKFSGDLSLEGSTVGSLDLTYAEFGKIFLRWRSIGHLAYDETAYQLLINNFKTLNFLEDANECYYDYRNARRTTLSLIYQPIDCALMLFYGYGVKPERPVICAFVFIAFFALIFWWRQGILPIREGEPEEEAARFTLLEAAAFSAMTFLSGGKLVFDPPEYRIATGRPWHDVQICKAIFVWERLMGMILVVMFAIAVSKTIILGS